MHSFVPTVWVKGHRINRVGGLDSMASRALYPLCLLLCTVFLNSFACGSLNCKEATAVAHKAPYFKDKCHCSACLLCVTLHSQFHFWVRSTLQSGGAQSLAGRPGCSGPWFPLQWHSQCCAESEVKGVACSVPGKSEQDPQGTALGWSVTPESVIRMMEVDDGSPDWGHSLNKAEVADSSADRSAVCHFLDGPSSYCHSSHSPSVSSQLATPPCVALRYPNPDPGLTWWKGS